MAAIGEKTDGTCTNCGGPGDDLEGVRRVYVTVDDHGRVTASETVEDPEEWCRSCRSCRSLYPHEPRAARSPGAPTGAGDPPPDDRSS